MTRLFGVCHVFAIRVDLKPLQWRTNVTPVTFASQGRACPPRSSRTILQAGRGITPFDRCDSERALEGGAERARVRVARRRRDFLERARRFGQGLPRHLQSNQLLSIPDRLAEQLPKG